jgi:hypothetical protein
MKNRLLNIKNRQETWVVVIHAYNSSYPGSRDEQIVTQAKPNKKQKMLG